MNELTTDQAIANMKFLANNFVFTGKKEEAARFHTSIEQSIEKIEAALMPVAPTEEIKPK